MRLPSIADWAWECKKRKGRDLEMGVISPWVGVQCTLPYNEEGPEMWFSCHADLALAME
jgi:hypothetical protein